MANTDRCPDCNALYEMVGYRHRCIPIRPVVAKPPQVDTSDKTGPTRVGGLQTSSRKSGALAGETESYKASGQTSTYRYRDGEARRAYQREYMKQYRARQK